MAPVQGPPLYRPFRPGEARPNADGSYSTEVLTTWQLPTGEWVNVPSLWMGPQGPVQFDEGDEESILTNMHNHEQMAGPSFQRFGSVEEAVTAAKARSHAGGAGSGPQTGKPRMTLSDIRQQYPQYQDMSDDQLADALHRKFYSDMPREEFNAKVGIAQPQPQQPAKPYDGGAFDAATEGSHAGVFFGFDDELSAGMLAPIDAAIDWWKGDGFDMGRAYTRKQKMLDERKQARREAHPVASTAGEIVGGVAAGGSLAKGGATLVGRNVPRLSQAAPRLTQTGLAATEGAAYGGLYGAGEAKPGERLEGASTGAMIGGIAGGALQSAGNALATRAARKAAQQAAPTSDDLASAAQRLYRASEAEGVNYKAPSVQRLGQNLKIAAGRINDRLRPKTAGFMDDVDNLFTGDVPLEVMDEFRKSLGKEIKRASPDDARTLSSMKRVLDAYLDRVGPGDFTGNSQKAVSLLKDARLNWARAAKTETIENILDQAGVDGAGKYTQSGFANAVRQEMRSLYKSIQKGKQTGWTQEEIALIKQMAMGGANSRIINLFAKFAPRGVVSIVGGQAAGSLIPGVGNVLVPLAGHVAGEAADRGAMAAAQALRTGAATGTAPRVAGQITRKTAPLIGGGAIGANSLADRARDLTRVR